MKKKYKRNEVQLNMINESSGENISFDKTVEKKKIDLLETRNKLID